MIGQELELLEQLLTEQRRTNKMLIALLMALSEKIEVSELPVLDQESGAFLTDS